MMQYSAGQSLVSPLRDPVLTLRRRMLVKGLFKHVKEIRGIDDGYAFQFHRLDDLRDLIGKIGDYIQFEGRNSPQLTFAIVEEPRAKAFWLQVRSMKSEKHDVASASVSSDSSGSSLV
jgi:hypothetical protein